MKKNIITSILITLSFAVLFNSCGAKLDAELYDATVGKRAETTPPGTIKDLRASAFETAISLQWENPTDKDFYGLTISASPAAGSLDKPITFINEEIKNIPQALSVNNLTGNVSYTFTVVTFDRNLNYSDGVSVTVKTIGESGTSNGKFFGTGEVFAYKKSKSAFDFGYCNEETVKKIEIYAKDFIDTSDTTMSSEGKMGNGSYEITSIEPKRVVNAGEKITINVKYKPSSIPSWDEMDMLIGGRSDSKLTLIGSSFKQPNNIESYDSKNEKDLGLKLWLRADLIGLSDVTTATGGLVKRIPDYSGRGIHAYCTDTNYNYAPLYEENDRDFNGLPGINFESTNTNNRKAQFLCMGSGTDPIIDSSKGSTTFVVVKAPVGYSTQTVISSNYGQSFPILANMGKYVNEENGYGTKITYGWAVRGSGLKGDYRFPFLQKKTSADEPDDPDKVTWFSNERSTTTSICMIYDQEVDAYATKNANGRYDFPSNIRMQMNGEESLVSYIHTNNSSTDNRNSGTTLNCYGAYGKPISDAKGHRYETLSEVKTPTTDEYNAKNNEIYYHWNSDVTNTCATHPEIIGRFKGTRPNDWAYTYTPYEYINENGEFEWLYIKDYVLSATDLKSFASSDAGCPNAAYYTNWISNEPRRNGTVYSMFIGADNYISTLYRGKIAEVIMFDYVLSSEEIDIVDNYIYYRYGIGSES